MIRIVNGTYGYRNPETNQIEAKTAKSKPFSLPGEREKELVFEGVAEYVDTGEDGVPWKDMEMQDDRENGIPRYSIRDSVEKLREIAMDLGVEVSEKMKKKEIMEAIDRKMTEDHAEENEEEGGPVTSAFMPE